uniref:Uncharacterized protein n=1 Tax=Oryza brachyantha TaxID=4533 RepID=J3MN88_ORYBR
MEREASPEPADRGQRRRSAGSEPPTEGGFRGRISPEEQLKAARRKTGNRGARSCQEGFGGRRKDRAFTPVNETGQD